MSNIFECQYLQCFSFDCWNSSLGLSFWSHSRTQCAGLLEISFKDRSHLFTWFHQLVMTFPCVPKDKQPFKYSFKQSFVFFISKETFEDPNARHLLGKWREWIRCVVNGESTRRLQACLHCSWEIDAADSTLVLLSEKPFVDWGKKNPLCELCCGKETNFWDRMEVLLFAFKQNWCSRSNNVQFRYAAWTKRRLLKVCKQHKTQHLNKIQEYHKDKSISFYCQDYFGSQ